MSKRSTWVAMTKVYCRLRPAAGRGVGIFAIRDIPRGANPFVGAAESRWYKYSKEQINSLAPELAKIARDFFGQEEDGSTYMPEGALNNINISFFLNHSEKPNVRTIDQGTHFVTIRKIKKGEELFSDYRTYDKDYQL